MRRAAGLLPAIAALVLLGVLAVAGVAGVRAVTGGRSEPVAGRSPAPPSPRPASAPAAPVASGDTGGGGSAAPSGEATLPPSAEPGESPGATTDPTPPPDDTSTLDDALQAAAERAVGGDPDASLIALDMTSGEIRATVHRQAGMSGAVAPGSTFKIVTSALLLTKGAVTPSGPAPCPETSVVNGQVFTNVDHMARPGATFAEAFSLSCNTSFIELRDRIADDELSAFATAYFGLNSDAWTVAPGQGTVDGVVPPADGPNDKAAQMIGQGRLRMNPMTMASVVATAVTGTFHQPVLERGMPVHTVSGTLPARVTSAIRAMMIRCATSGTAGDVFAGMPGVGAKTGTAEVGDRTDGWIVAFRGDIAVAVYVRGGTSGSAAAGPIAREFLMAVPAGA